MKSTKHLITTSFISIVLLTPALASAADDIAVKITPAIASPLFCENVTQMSAILHSAIHPGTRRRNHW